MKSFYTHLSSLTKKEKENKMHSLEDAKKKIDEKIESIKKIEKIPTK